MGSIMSIDEHNKYVKNKTPKSQNNGIRSLNDYKFSYDTIEDKHKKAQDERQKAINDYWNLYEDKGVSVNKGSVFAPAADNFAAVQKQTQQNMINNIGAKLPYVGDTVDTFKTQMANQQKFNEVAKSTEAQEKQKIVAEKEKEYQTVKKEANKDKWYNKILQTPEAFKDGYQFGDVTKTALSTAGDIGAGIGKGAINLGDSVARAASGLIAETSALLGNEELAQKIRNNLATKENPLVTGANQIQNVVNNNSVSGDTLDKVAEAVGYTATLGAAGKALGGASNIAVGKLNVPTLAAIGGAGSGFTEAYQKDAKGVQAWGKALGSGAIEGITEGLFGMFGVGGNEITDQWGQQAANLFKNGAAKVLAKTGVSATGEAAEEFLSYLGNQGLDLLIDTASSENDPKFYEKWNWEKVGEEMAIAFISSGLAQGANTMVNIQQEYNNAVSQEEQRLGRSLTQLELQNIKNEVIDNVINEKDKTDQNNIAEINQIETVLDELRAKRANTQNTQKQAQYTAKINQLEQQLKVANKNIQNIQNTLAENTQETQNKPNLPKVTQQTEVKLPKVEPTTFEASAKYHNINPKTDEYKFAQAIKNKLGVEVLFKNNVKTLKGEKVNGLYNPFTKTIELNLDSGQTVQHLLTHELTHALEGTPEYQTIQKLVMDYSAKTGGDLWLNAVNDLSSAYYNEYGNRPDFNSKIQSEATAEILGNLINDQNFLNDLAVSNPTIFTRLYALINELIARVTGSEKAYLKAIKAKMEIAWAEAGNGKLKTDGDIKYSVVGTKGANNSKVLTKLLDKAQQYYSEGKPNEKIRQDTGWFRDKKGNWKFEISDFDAYITGNLSKNTTYKLGQILKHDTLYKIYPELKKLEVRFMDGLKTASYSSVQDVIGIPNSRLNNLYNDELIETMIHEIQHKIQHIENFPHGASIRLGKIKYANALGEIEAADTARRVNMTQEQLREKAPESSKKNPIHPQRDEILTSKLDKIKSNIYNLFNEEDFKDNTISNMDNSEVIRQDNRQNPRENRGGELDNSSFSYDNQGRTLSKEQQEFFKDSKARDENGELVTVYHTTTNEMPQFNEFNPVGTEYYRFGDQVVNYYTDSKDMSGSYADQDYVMADTKKITSMKEVNDYIKTMNNLGWGSYRNYELIQEDGKYKLIDNTVIPNIGKTKKQVYNEANKYKKSLTDEELAQFKDMFENEVRTGMVYDIDAYLKSKGYAFGSKQDKIAQKYLSIDNKNIEESGIYFDVLMRDAKYHTVKTFKNKDELFRKIKDLGSSSQRRQYEGYVNITNPYVADAEQRNWNQVVSQSNEFIDELDERVPQEIKNNLTRLYRESEEKSSDLRTQYNILERFVRGTNEYLNTNKNTDSLQKVLNRIGVDAVNSIVDENSNGLNVNTYYGLAEELENAGIIGKETAKIIIDDFKIPESVQKWIKNNYNKKLQAKDLYPQTNILVRVLEKNSVSLKELYEKSNTAYEEFDKYRMPNSYFLEQIASEGRDYLGNDLNDMFETRAEIYSPEQVGEEIAQAASVAFSKPEMIRLWGTSKTTNDVVKEIIASNKDGSTNYDGVIIRNVYDYGGKSKTGKKANDLYITFNSNQFKAVDNTNPTNDPDIRYSQDTNGAFNQFIEEKVKPINQNKRESTFKDITNRVLNPSEIAQLKPEDANTTPNLPKVKRNVVGNGDSSFFGNIQNKTNMLNEEQKQAILDNGEVKYYDKITNKESLDKAFNRLNTNGKYETTRWFNNESKNATATDVAEGWILLKQYADSGNTDGMVEVAKKLRDIGTKAGQTVQAFNILERLTPQGMVAYAQSELMEAYDNLVKNKTQEWINKHKDEFQLTPDDVQFIMDTMKEVSRMEDGYDKKVKLAEIQKLITDKIPADAGKSIKSWMRISMLFNPKTQVRNVMGNAVIAPVKYFGDIAGSVADKLISRKTGVRTTGTTNIKAMLKGFKEGAYQATNDYRKGINTKDMEGNRFEIGEGKSFNEKTLIGKSLNRVDRLLNYAMDVGDRVFSQSYFENSLQNQMKLNNTTEVTQDMIDIARTEALQNTWNDNNKYTKFVLDVRRGLNQIKIPGTNGYGLGDVLIPFAKTPANLTKAIVDYSPVGMVNALTSYRNMSKAISKGEFTPQMQHEFVQRLGKATAGTMLYVLGAALAKSGVISGESDDDKDTKNFLKNTLGINSYSVKIGDKTFTYDWAQPIAAPLSIMANIEKTKSNKEQALLEGIVSSLDTAGSILLEQSFLQSINEVLTDNSGVVSGLQNAVLDLPARAVPTLMKQITDLTDSTQRQTFEYDQPLKTAVNKIKAKLPGLSETLAPSVDTLGREIQKYGGKNNIFNVFLNPANVNTENISKSAEEIYRLYQETGRKDIMPRVSPYYINKNGEKTILDSTQKAEYQKVSGKIIEDNVSKLLKNSSYKNLSNDEKAEVVNDIVNYAYNVAQKDVLGMDISSTYSKPYTYSQIGNVADFYVMKSQDFTADKDSNGKSISGSKKDKVVNYINSMSLSVPEKAILIKMNGYAVPEYDDTIINYINDKKLSVSEKTNILTSLGYTVKDGKVYK